MPILATYVKTKHREFVTRTKCFFYSCEHAKKPRGVRMSKTGEGKKKRNQRKAYLKRKYEMYNNFDIGDWFFTFTNCKDFDADTQHKTVMKILSKAQQKLKRKGIPFTYYVKTEAGERVRPHTHALIKNTSPEIVSILIELWQENGNVKDIKPIYNLANGKLITYILDGGDHKELNYEKYSHSRNLVPPVVEKRIYPYNSFRQQPRPPKAEYGYKYEVRNLKNWFPDRDGFVYQEYELELVKLKEVQQE